MVNTLQRHSKKVLIGLLGGTVVLLGLVLVPYPGPGWLIVFGGLAILSTEFAFAAKVLEAARSKYDAWTDWLKRQHWAIKSLVLAATGLVVVTTIWLLNGFGLIVQFFDLPYEALISPLFR